MEQRVDREIVSRLLMASPDRWQKLWSAVDDLLAEGAGPHATSVIPEARPDGTIQAPYVTYSDPVNRVHQALYDVGAVYPFDWMRWEGVERYRGGRELDTAVVADAVRILTAVLRGERFGDGCIARALDDGTLLAALHRLRTWYDGIDSVHRQLHAHPDDRWWSIPGWVRDIRLTAAILRSLRP